MPEQDCVCQPDPCVATRLLALKAMKFGKRAIWIGRAVVIFLMVCNIHAEDSFPVLQAEGQTYTNVVIQNVTETHLFFSHAGGSGSVKLQSLDPALQKRFGYHTPKAGTGIQSVNVTAAPLTPIELVKSGSDIHTTVQHEYVLRDIGTLRLTFPGTWKDSCVQTAAPAASSALIRFDHFSDDGFVLSLSFLPKGNMFERMEAQQALAIPGNFALRESVEKSLTFEQLNGDQARGYYFTLMDKYIAESHKLMPHRHAWQSQGFVKFGDEIVCFAIESNATKEADLETALEVIKTATLESVKPQNPQ